MEIGLAPSFPNLVILVYIDTHGQEVQLQGTAVDKGIRD